MWHKFKKDLFSYYSMQKVNGVMGVNGIMRTCHIYFVFALCVDKRFGLFPQLQMSSKLLLNIRNHELLYQFYVFLN